MARIVAGRFETEPTAEQAVRELRGVRCGERDINVFFNPAPGQHGSFRTGGDEHADAEARGAARHTVKGVALGAGLGLLAGSIAGGPLGATAGAAVGGYAGSLAGTLHGLGKEGRQQRRWPAGVMVAVNLDGGASEPEVLRILRDSGAEPVQVVDGEWGDGQWRDFNPVSAAQPGASARAQVVYRIFPGGYGKWNVFEGDLDRLLSEFYGRQEAVDYATSLARTKKLAVVEIYRAGGVLESSRVFSHSEEQSSKAMG